MNECKVCNSQKIHELTDYEKVVYKGEQLSVLLGHSVCGLCEREFISKGQIANNEKIIRDAKKIHDGLFSSQEIADARIKLGLTQEQASLVFGGGRNAFSKYERGEVSQSVAMDKLIKQALKHSVIFNDLLESAGVSLNASMVISKPKVITKSALY